MGSENNWMLPALFGVIVGILSLALSKIWDEVKGLRNRAHDQTKAVLNNDAKLAVLAEKFDELEKNVDECECHAHHNKKTAR